VTKAPRLVNSAMMGPSQNFDFFIDLLSFIPDLYKSYQKSEKIHFQFQIINYFINLIVDRNHRCF